ncbi:hypothetical protein ACWGID_28375 [Kribbella sp. NPDC054772]
MVTPVRRTTHRRDDGVRRALPFSDNVDEAHRYGVTHIAEPGGSIRSDEVAAACAERGIRWSATGVRLFRH